MKQQIFDSYFEGDYILSKGCLFNGVFSDRSDGKTFDCKYRALRDYEEFGTITCYVRRWKTEITKEMYENWFDEVLEKDKGKPYRRWEFKYSRKCIKVKRPQDKEFNDIVYFCPLSVSARLKSQFAQATKVKIIDFDEYFPLDNLFIKNEMKLLLELWKTFDRDRNEVQVMILGNKINLYCPFLDFFKVDFKIGNVGKLKTYRNDTLALQIYVNTEHREKREKTKFRDLIEGTEYDEYDKGGILNALNFKIRSRKGGDYICSFKTENGEGSIWYKNGELIISRYLRKDGYILCDKIYNTGRREYLCNSSNNLGKSIKMIYSRGDLAFEDERSLYNFQDILNKICRV